VPLDPPTYTAANQRKPPSTKARTPHLGAHREQRVEAGVREAHKRRSASRCAAIVSISGDAAVETYSTAYSMQTRIWGKPYPSTIDGSMQKELKHVLCSRLKR
jgi:hypothetical protein